MTDNRSSSPLEEAVPWAQAGIWATGALVAVDNLRGGAWIGALTSLLAWAVAGLVADRLLVALARVVEAQRVRAEAAERAARWCEETLGPAVGRLADALERGGAIVTPAAPASGSKDDLIGLRRAIAEREWALAEQLIREFVVSYPEHPDASRLADELAQGREAAAQDVLVRLEAARAANDPDRVLELREALGLVLSGEPLRALDRDLGKWFLQVIHKRLRAGGVKPDIPLLAARVADTLDTTPEGASLRASLPTLRRSAGLCARCAEPYTGIADACPKCVASAHAAPTGPPTPEPEEHADGPEDDPSRNGRADDPFLPDRLN